MKTWIETPLFDDVPPATRNTDPITSAKGEASVRFRRGSQCWSLLKAFGDTQEPMTDDMAANSAGLYTKIGCCWWKRVGELRAMGLITAVGERISPYTDEDRMACVITDKGRSCLASFEN